MRVDYLEEGNTCLATPHSVFHILLTQNLQLNTDCLISHFLREGSQKVNFGGSLIYFNSSFNFEIVH